MGRVVLTAPSGGFPGGSVVKNPPANIGDASLILSWEDHLERGMATHSSVLAWESGKGVWRAQSIGSQKLSMIERRNNGG